MVAEGTHAKKWRQAIVTRSAPSAPDSLLDEDSHSRSVLSAEEEQRWQEQHMTDGIRKGATTMFFVTFSYMVLGCIRCPKEFRSISCVGLRDYLSPTTARFIEVSYLAISHGYPLVGLPVFYSCIKRPRKVLYVFMVSSFFFYLVILGLPPPVKTTAAGRWFCSVDRRSSLREHGTVHLIMAWILLTPTVLPTQRMLHLTWVYIGVGYVGASVIFHIYVNEGQFMRGRWLVDASLCTLLIAKVNMVAINKKYYIEKGQRSKFVMDLKHKESTRRMFNILEYMVPVHLIAPMLKNPGRVIAEQVECASILFIMFVDFDQTASRLEPHELLDFLNHHFTLFDGICARHGVTKIETVGEEYVCAVGVVPADVEKNKTEGHQEILGKLITAAAEILKVAEENDEVVLKMGIHTGPVVAGVIGNKLPRFRLFGDTINTAARMMQKGLPGEVQFGEETYNSLPRGVDVEHRGKIEMKGKGQVETYLLRRRKSSPAMALAPSTEPTEKKVKFSLTVETRSVSGRNSEEPCAQRDSSCSQRRSSSRKTITETLMQTIRDDANTAPTVASTSGAAGRPVDASQHAWTAATSRRSVQEVELTRLRPQAREGHGLDGTSGRPLLETTEAERATAVSRTQGGLDEASFEKTVQEVCAASLGGGKQTGEGEQRGPMDRTRRWLRSLGPGWDEFPTEMEEGFSKWYHESAIVKKLDRRLETQVLMASLQTTMELLFSVFGTGVFLKESSTRARLPVFLASRMIVCVIIMGWRLSFEQPWMKKAPQYVQVRIMLSYALIVVLWFLSYDMLTIPTASPETLEDVFTLLFVPVYVILTTLHPLLFVNSCFFVVEAVLLMYMTTFLFENLYFGLASMFVIVGYSVLNAYLAHDHERSLRARYRANANISLAQNRIEHILNTLMPVQVVEEIRENELHAPPRAHEYRCATVAQSDLCGFTKLASTRTPEEVVEFISELFGAFDELTDTYEIYKVETVGDAYIAGQADVPLTYKNLPLSVVLFGLEMIRAVHEWSRNRGFCISCRVGVHTGKCVGGIVGTEMQRYHLFGRLMSGLEVLESTAPEGRVQVSIACKEAVEGQLRAEGREVNIFEPRQETRLTTSKGEIHEFDEVGGPTFIAKSYAQIRGQLKVGT
uniref:Guanylate cyclase domain-containing protein n=1 Tax=Alexandrium monilatum TaxID=311494 RepID=A0A7S4R2B4_9DINO